MTDKIKIQCYKNGELCKEIEEENVIVLSEFSRSVMLSRLGVCEAVMLMVQLSYEYDRLLNILKDKFQLPEDGISLLIKTAKIELIETR